MIITGTDIYKFSIPMHPFTIATGTMHYAQNIFIRVHTSNGLYGVGECSAFPMIVGETQATCFEMAKDFAAVWKGKDALQIEDRMNELHAATAFNSTIKSAFDMALYDLAAKASGQRSSWLVVAPWPSVIESPNVTTARAREPAATAMLASWYQCSTALAFGRSPSAT